MVLLLSLASFSRGVIALAVVFPFCYVLLLTQMASSMALLWFISELPLKSSERQYDDLLVVILTLKSQSLSILLIFSCLTFEYMCKVKLKVHLYGMLLV